MSSEVKPKSTKKKGHYVASRYKQAAEKVSIDASKEKSMFFRKDGPSLPISGDSSRDASGSLKLNTPQKTRGMTSTPSSKGELTFPPLDESAVTNTKDCLTVPHLKERIGSITADTVKKNLTKKSKWQDETLLQPHGPVVVSRKDKKKNVSYNKKIADAELDLAFACYLQAAFLESEAKKSLEARSSSAVETLHKLLTLVLQHLNKVKSQKTYLKIFSTLIEVHEHCQRQEALLKPVFEALPVVEEQYHNLAATFKAVKPNLPIKDVLLPEPSSEGEIIEILQKMAEFITAFFEALPNCDIISASGDLKKYVVCGELFVAALERGLNLVMENKELCISEASLTLGCEKS